MDDTTSATANGKLLLNQVDDLYTNLGYTNAAVILIASFLAWILWPVAGKTGLVPWYTCILLLNLWSILLALLYKRAAGNKPNVQAWLNTYIAGIFLSGLCWGTLLLYVVPPNATVHLLAACFIVAGLVTGSAATLASLKFGFAVFSVPAVLPGAIFLIYLNRPTTFLIGCSLIAFLVFILFIALRIHRTIYYSLRKQVEVGNKLALLEIEKTQLDTRLETLEGQLAADQAELEQLRIALKHKPQPGAALRRVNELKDHRFISLLDELTGGVWDMYMKTGELVVSPGWLTMLGYDSEDTRKQLDFWESILHPDDRLPVLNKLHAFAAGSLPEFTSSHRLRNKNGDWVWVMARAHGVIWDSYGEMLNIAGMELHVPESGEAAGRSLDLLNFDINDWLMNREDFDKRFRQLIATASLEGIEHSLCHIRIIRMHDDAAASESLDEIRLYEVGRVLLNEFRHGDALLRLGSDSYALLLAFCKPEDAWDKARCLQNSLRELALSFKGSRLALAVSIGITPVTAKVDDIASIMQDAQTACDLALSGTSNLVYLYQRDNPQLGTSLFENHVLQQLRDGLRTQALQLQAIPLQPLATGFTGEEQLLAIRISLDAIAQERYGGADFAVIAQQHQLATRIDAYVIARLVNWLAQDVAGQNAKHRVCFYDCADESCLEPGFLALVLKQLARLPEQNATLCLGVSANVWTAHREATAHFLTSVRAAGGKTALTNFGDAATVKNLIHDCHVDFLKLDATLLQNLEQDRSNGITVKYINDIIHLAGVKSIVEVGPVGLPANVLKTMNIDFVQPRL